MQDLYIFVTALDYIEQHLSEDISQEDIARHCCCSVSALQKMWTYCTHSGVMQYVRKRRLTLAAREIAAGAPVLDTAVKYGYGSNEAFTRAFRGMWDMTPTEYAETRRFTDMYPRMNGREMKGEDLMRTKFDLTEIYDRLADKKGTYIVCFDIRGLDRVNREQGKALGDAVIRACVARMERALTDDMCMFRVGGDEFAVVTGFADRASAQRFAETVAAGNDELVTLDGETAQAYLNSGLMLYDDSITDFYETFAESVDRSANS